MIRFLLISFFVMTFNVQTYAFELLMFNNKHCIFCNKFLEEVGPEYNISDLPLIIIDEDNGLNGLLQHIKKKELNLLEERQPLFYGMNLKNMK